MSRSQVDAVALIGAHRADLMTYYRELGWQVTDSEGQWATFYVTIPHPDGTERLKVSLTLEDMSLEWDGDR